jgi:hypothetical protein
MIFEAGEEKNMGVNRDDENSISVTFICDGIWL